MLTDPHAIQIISRARQKNVAAADRSDRDIRNIFGDFFDGREITDEIVLELGPGQFDFARLLRDRGAVVSCVDNDPPVVELGRHLGLEVMQGDLEALGAWATPATCDGLFCKFAINAFWFQEPQEVRHYVLTLDSLLTRSGWGWIAPWNGVPKSGPPPAGMRLMLDVQRETLRQCGWHACILDRTAAERYGVTGCVANNVLFVKNLPLPAALRKSRICFPFFPASSR